MPKKTSKRIVLGKDGDPRKQAASAPYSPAPEPKYLPKSRMHFSAQKPGGFLKRAQASSSTSSTSTVGAGSAQSVAQSPLYYDYRWSTPDKFYFPRNRIVANAIWRQVYMRDAVIAVATDMYAELPWSGFDLIGIDDPDIKKFYEDMFNDLDLVPKLPEFTKDFLILGECILHTLFNSKKGYWERAFSHNPDFVRVEGVGLISEQPLMWMRPTPEIKRLLGSPDRRVRKLQQILPREIINAFRRNQEVPLDEVNTTFLCRKINSTDVRGTSLYTRLYRTIMYEDFVVNASLAVSQRMAAPLRIFKLGSNVTGWLPSPDDEAAFSEMLSMAESDPLAAIVTHNDVTTELVGVADRALLISKEWDFLERIKLMALGVAKSFLMGEASLASAVAGLQTLLERAAVLRMKFEDTWIRRKLCEPVAKMNDFYKRPQSELEHRIRVKTKDEMELITPKIKWHKTLDPMQDTSILGVWRDLKERGILSDRTYASGAGLDLDVERKNQKEEKKYVEDNPEQFGMTPAGFPKDEAPAGRPPAPGGRPAPPGGKPPGPGGWLPPPVALPGSEANKEAAKESLYNDIEDELHMRSDKQRKVAVEDVMEVIDESELLSEDPELLEKISSAEKSIPLAGKSLLAGE